MNRHGEVLKIDNVATAYEGEKRPTIKNISFQVNAGELVFVVGPNGAGNWKIDIHELKHRLNLPHTRAYDYRAALLKELKSKNHFFSKTTS